MMFLAREVISRRQCQGQAHDWCTNSNRRLLPASGRWKFFRARQLKDGQLQDIKPVFSLEETLMRQPAYLTEVDLRLIRLVIAVHSHHGFYSDYPLQGSSGAEVLELALKTSRLFLDF